jgi:hypothetical protein
VNQSWAAIDKSVLENNIRKDHAEEFEEIWKKCALIHPKTQEEHIVSAMDRQINTKTDPSTYCQRKFKCNYTGSNAKYEWIGKSH